MRIPKIFKSYKKCKYCFFYDGTSKIRIFLNIVRFLFYKLINKRFVIAKVHGNKMLLDLNVGMSKSLLICNTRELLDTDIIMDEIKDDMNVLDVGANIGYYAILEASLLNNGKVYAFEPDPRNIEMLKKNIKINNFSQKIKLYPYAIAEKNCIREFNLSEQTNLSSFTGKQENVGFVKVNCVKLNNFAKEKNIDFIRMDIEEYECMAIAGMLDFLRIKQNLKLLIEVHPSTFNMGEFSFLEELASLEKFGFRVKYLISAGEARPDKIIQRGYKPIKVAREGERNRGLYKNVKMGDLISFLKNDTKIVRSILLEKI